MTLTEARDLAIQLGLSVKSARGLYEQVQARGWSIGIDNTTAEWVVLDDCQNVLARCN